MSGLWGSPQMRKFGSRGAVAINMTANFLNPKPQALVHNPPFLNLDWDCIGLGVGHASPLHGAGLVLSQAPFPL